MVAMATRRSEPTDTRLYALVVTVGTRREADLVRDAIMELTGIRACEVRTMPAERLCYMAEPEQPATWLEIIGRMALLLACVGLLTFWIYSMSWLF